MYNIKNKKAEKIEAITFSALGMQENDIEEILRCSIDMLCDDEESMLIVGRQVKNEKLGRSDLTAVDNNGNIVLIEIKRDRKDIESRKEAFEFQAIRYAASYATIVSTDDLVKKVYAPYIEIYLNAEKLLPLTNYDDYYVNLMDKSSPVLKQNKDFTRRSLPKIDTLLGWGVVKAGDIIVAKDRDNEGTLLKNGNMSVNGIELSIQMWLKEVYGWSSVQTYNFAVHKESGKTLSQIREEYMNEQAVEVAKEI